MKEYFKCHGPVHTCFDENNISSTLHVRVPADMINSVKEIPTENMIKLRCSLGYSQTMGKLFLELDSDVISMVDVVIN